jgi:hypothetical protein
VDWITSLVITMAETPLSKLELAGKHSAKATGIVFMTIKQVAFFLSLRACFDPKLTPLITSFYFSLRATELLMTSLHSNEDIIAILQNTQ